MDVDLMVLQWAEKAGWLEWAEVVDAIVDQKWTWLGWADFAGAGLRESRPVNHWWAARMHLEVSGPTNQLLVDGWNAGLMGQSYGSNCWMDMGIEVETKDDWD
ncbi:hypothetical protein LIER_38736 [Lithospermum erythrorhizon]|uniref:Uncharacterized protein n=1 Tax=Lithospermum erythrorhizon TaxID=34254 RepID=A0AAV3Q430_LITER